MSSGGQSKPHSQPAAKPPMTSTHNAHSGSGSEEHEKPSLARMATEKFIDKTAEDAADKTVDYVTDDPEQKLQDVEDEAKGLFTKYCGCLAS